MRTEEARPVRLEDYRPPDWLVETVELDVALDPDGDAGARDARAQAQSATAAAPAPLVLDGDGLNLVSLKLDGAPLAAEQLCRDRRTACTIAQPPQRPFRLEIETVVDPSANTQLHGPLPLGRDLLHPVRGRGLPPHHLFPRPARRDGGLHHPHRGREGRRAGAARQRQPGRRRRRCPARAGISRSGTIRSRSRPTCSRWSAASSACVEDRFRTMSGREVDAAHLCRARQGEPLRLRHGRRSSAPCAGTRTRSAANTISTSS